MSCETNEDILRWLEVLENEGHLILREKNGIQNFKFFLRFLRRFVKWNTRVGYDVRSKHTDPLEEILSSLLRSIEMLKEEFSKHFSCNFVVELYDRKFAYKDVLIDELVLEWIVPLMINLDNLISCDGCTSLAFPKEQIEDLLQKLMGLDAFLYGKRCTLKGELEKIISRHDLLQKTSKDLFRTFEYRVRWPWDSWDSWHKQFQEIMEKLLFDLLVKINHIEPEIRMIYVQLLKASKTANPSTLLIDLQVLAAVDSLLDNLQKLLKDQDTGCIIPLDVHQIEFLHQELSFLKYFLMDPHLKQYTKTEPQSFNCFLKYVLKCFLMDPHLKQYTKTEPQSFNSLLLQVETMVIEAAALTHSICVGKTRDQIADQMSLLHSALPKIIDLLKAEIREMYLRVPKSSILSFPRTPNLSFLDFFLQRLDELLKHRADSIAYVKNEIEIVQSELGFLGSFVSDPIKKPEEDEHITRRVVDVAYEAERVIDLISASNLPSWYYMLWLSDVIEKIKMLRKDSIEMSSKKTCDINVLNVEKASIHDPPQTYILAAEEGVVGFNDEAGKIMDRLTIGSKQLDIVSIVGMPGLGKTTIAKKVYDHPSITSYFDVRSWYAISHVYEKRELLLSILGHTTELTEEILEMNDEDLAEVLYRSLKGKLYLIVLDDIWSIEPWDDIRNAFPDDCNGSRILFTTRHREVSLQASPTSAPHELRLFSDEESWKLLQNKVFRQSSCPPKLHEIGKLIAKNCRGLPLSVVVIAGVLTRLDKSELHWKQVSETLSKQVFGNSSKCTDVLELSYKHLPDHLKPCFLYLGAFPEDREIPTWKLIRLWIAEGFVRKTNSESLENIAEGYLMDLIARSLVLVAQTKSIGGVKSCRLHDLLHEFSLNKAKDENFLLLSRESVNAPEQYRYSFCGKEITLYGWMPNDPYVRTMLYFPSTGRSHHINYMADYHPVPSSIFKLLRVLDLGRIPLGHGEFPTWIELLVHLRYLAIRGAMNRIPSSVGNLWRLETFVVKGTKGEVKLPETLLKMAYLKHVCVGNWAAFELPDTFQTQKSFGSNGIEKFSTPSLRHGDGTTDKLIRSFRSLRKLKCIFFESWDYFGCCNRFPVLDVLSKLESLNVTYCGTVKLASVFSFPSNLKKFTLSKFRLPWSEISKIGKLPQLQVLKLVFRAFEGRRWDVSDDEFQNLKVLKLENLNIVEWDASPGAFPRLEQLALQRCKQLEKVPSSFEELNTLQMIEVKWCSYSATKAVCKIRKEQQDLRPDGLRVLIQPLDWDSAPVS